MTRRRLQAFAFACLFALAITPADAARQKKELHYYDQHSVGAAVYLPQVQDRKYPGPGKYKKAVKSKKAAVRVAARRVAPVTSHAGSPAIVAEARRHIGTNPTGQRSLWCADFTNYVLRRLGLPTTGSRLAKDFGRYGTRVSGPQAGAIAVMTRRGGGHVGVVSGIDAKGNVIVISGNAAGRSGNRVVSEGAYPRGRIYAYVMP